MAKNKSSETPHYELLYIISNKYSENELSPIIEKAEKIINDNGGDITYKEEWGKKRLAYPIKHFHHGYYYLVEFDLAGEKVVEINKALRMTSEILRHQIVNKKKRSVEEIEQEKKLAEKIAAGKNEEESEKKKSSLVSTSSKASTDKTIDDSKDFDQQRSTASSAKEVNDATEKKDAVDKKALEDKGDKEKKVELKDLDKKLDKILKTDDLL